MMTNPHLPEEELPNRRIEEHVYTDSPTLAERKDTSAEITKSFSGPNQYLIGVGVVGIVAMISIVVLAFISRGATEFVVISGVLVSIALSIVNSMTSSLNKTAVAEVKTRMDGRFDEMLDLQRKAGKSDAEKTAHNVLLDKYESQLAEAKAAPVVPHVEEMNVETLKVEKQVKK